MHGWVSSRTDSEEGSLWETSAGNVLGEGGLSPKISPNKCAEKTGSQDRISPGVSALTSNLTCLSQWIKSQMSRP